jgi:hypothetical protein
MRSSTKTTEIRKDMKKAAKKMKSAKKAAEKHAHDDLLPKLVRNRHGVCG